MRAGDADAHPSLTGTSIGPYHFGARIGAGGMGEVYRATHETLGHDVAVKTIHAGTDDEMTRRRFAREARLACRVHHPYVATVLDVVEHDDDVLLVMEYIDGSTLTDFARANHLAPGDVVRLGVEIAEALAAIHRAGLVHRDLKPENVMVTGDGHVKVMDFGIARALPRDAPGQDETTHTHETRLTRTGRAPGTIPYMSPEQLRGEEVDGRSDLFALGVLLYETLSGEHPFERGNVPETVSAILTDAPGSGPASKKLDATGPMRDVVLRLLEKDRDRRFEDADALVRALRPVSVELPPAAATVERRRARWVAPVVGAVALVTAVTGFVWWRAQQAPAVPERRPVVAVLPFTMRVGGVPDEVRGEMLASLLAAELSYADHARSLGAERTRDILRGLEIDADVAARVRAVRHAAPVDAVLVGDVYREGDLFRANVSLYDADTADASTLGEPRSSVRVEAARITGLVHTTLARIPELLGVSASEEPLRILSDDDDANALCHEGNLALRDLRYGAAIDAYEGALERDPAFVLAQVRLVQALTDAGFIERARTGEARLRRLLDRTEQGLAEPVRVEVEAVRAAFRGDFTAAAQRRLALAETFPDDPERHYELADAYRRAVEPDAALRAIDAALALDPDDPRFRINRAHALGDTGGTREALQELERAERTYALAEHGVGLALVHFTRGYLDRRNGDLSSAFAEFQASADAYSTEGLPGHAARARNNVAEIRLRLGQIDEAIVDLEEVVRITKSLRFPFLLAHALNQLGAAALTLGQSEAAGEHFSSVVRVSTEAGLRRTEVLARTNLAALSAARDGPDRALLVANEALVAARALGDAARERIARILVASASFRAGDVSSALDHYDDVVRGAESDDDPVAATWGLLGRAEVFRGVGRYEDALATADEAIRASSELEELLPRASSDLARLEALVALGRVSEAEQAATDVERRISEAGTPAPENRVRILRAGGLVDYQAGRLDEAARSLESAAEQAREHELRELESWTRIAWARVAVERGKPRVALRQLDQADDAGGLGAIGAVESSCVAARAERDRGDTAAAIDRARRCLDDAERLGLDRFVAEAAAIRVGLDGDEAIAQRGRNALARFLDGMSESGRRSIGTLRHVREIADVLGVETD